MGLEQIALPIEMLRSDFIVSMPKLKTHHWAGMTASMKNFFGVVPGAVYGLAEELPARPWHPQLDRRPECHHPAPPVDRRRRDRDGRRRADNGNATAVGHDRHRTGCLCRGCDLCARDWTRSRSDPVSRGSGKVPRTHKRIAESITEASPWPVSPRGSRLWIPSSPSAWTGADRFGASLEVASGADHCVVPARTRLARGYRVDRSPADLRCSRPLPPASSLRLAL